MSAPVAWVLFLIPVWLRWSLTEDRCAPPKKCAGINFNTREKGGVVGPSVYPKEVRVLILIPVWQRRSLTGGRCAPSSVGIIFNTRVSEEYVTTKG